MALDLCIGEYDDRSPRYCTFDSGWDDDGEKTIYCRVFDGFEASEPDYILTIISDNTPPTQPSLNPSLIEGW